MRRRHAHETAIVRSRQPAEQGDFVAVDEEFIVDGVTYSLELPAGPYLKVGVTGLVLSFGGQVLTADVSYEKSTPIGSDGELTSADEPVVKIRFANVGLRIGTIFADSASITGEGSVLLKSAS